MNKKEYLKRLNELLTMSYQQLKDSNGRSQFGSEHVQGFMEAGLITGVVNKDDLEETIDKSHKVIFGITFKERSTASIKSPDILDIPTWVRRGIELK